MNVNGFKDYFKDPWNYIDQFSFYTYLAYFVLRMRDTKNTLVYSSGSEYITSGGEVYITDVDKLLVILNAAIVCFIMIKFLYFQKVFEKLGLMS